MNTEIYTATNMLQEIDSLSLDGAVRNIARMCGFPYDELYTVQKDPPSATSPCRWLVRWENFTLGRITVA